MDKDRGYSDLDLAEVSDNPEWTDADFARAVPFADAFPALAESLKGGIEIVRVGNNGPLEIEITGEVAAYYRSFGDEAQARLIADLRKIAGFAESV